MGARNKYVRGNNEVGLLKMEHRILHHEDLMATPFVSFTAEIARMYGTAPIPGPQQVKNTIPAFINHGRWLVSCPTCGSAAFVSMSDHRFWCVECQSPENDRWWYEVVFPADKAQIEDTLLKRPAVIEKNAINRNWFPNETLAVLKRENAEKGIK